ncbi:hypothetical protein JCM10450v2_004777 [Rhodotorula kratochvilovae]
MATNEPPQTPHRRASSSTSTPTKPAAAEITYRDAPVSASPAASSDHPSDEFPERSFSSTADDSLTFASDGSIVYRPRKSDSSFASSFEALSITDSVAALVADSSAPKSSSPGQEGAADLPPSPAHEGSPLAPKSATSIAPNASDPFEATPSKSTSHPGLLNPAAPTFASRPWYARGRATPIAIRFASIVQYGKDANGDLTRDAQRAMESIGLKAIPSLHGTPLLPYSRNPSGSDAFRFTVDGGEQGFERIPDEEIEYFASLRAAPLPLPGNARYTPSGRQTLAKQRNASAPAEKTSGGSSHQATGGSRRAATTPASSSTFSSRAAVGMPTTAASVLQQHQQFYMLQQMQQAHDDAWARQATLAQQAQQVQLSTQFLPYSPELSSPITPFSPFSPVSPSDSYSFGPSMAPFSPPYFHSPHVPFVPPVQPPFVDSSTLLEIATQQSVGSGYPGGSGTETTSGQSTRVTSYETAPDLDSEAERCVQAGEWYDANEQQDAFAASTSSRRRPSRVEAFSQRRHGGKHRSTLSDATVTAHTYLEQGRRKSAMASFPPPGGVRKSSIASTIPPGPRHVSSAAHIQYAPRSALNSPAASRRTSIVETVEPVSSSSETATAPYRPPMRRRDSTQLSVPPGLAASTKPASRAFSDIGNIASLAKVAAYATQLDTQQAHRAASMPVGAVPAVQLEPPTPKLPRATGQAASSSSPFAAQSRRGEVVTTTSGLPRAHAPSSPASSAGATVVPSEAQAPPHGGSQQRRKTRWKHRQRRTAEGPAASSSATAAP